MLTIAETFKYANLQMAAEAILADKITGQLKPDLVGSLKDGNNRSLKFTPTQAETFAAEWKVLDQIETPTAFSGTLFENKNSGELVLSMRSTEFIDDHARDNQATNRMELVQSGFAFGQIADMEAWFKQLEADPNKLKGKTYSVTGYSLGGHLATVFNLLRQEEAQAGPTSAHLDKVVTFNAGGALLPTCPTVGERAGLACRISTPPSNGRGGRQTRGGGSGCTEQCKLRGSAFASPALHRCCTTLGAKRRPHQDRPCSS